MLQKKEDRELEQQILNMTDLLIENIMATNMLSGETKEEELSRSVEVVVNLLYLMEEYLGGHGEHLGELLQQLTQQKLPDEHILESFGDFTVNLQSTIKQGLNLYYQQKDESDDNAGDGDCGTIEQEQMESDGWSPAAGSLGETDVINPNDAQITVKHEEDNWQNNMEDSAAMAVPVVAGKETMPEEILSEAISADLINQVSVPEDGNNEGVQADSVPYQDLDTQQEPQATPPGKTVATEEQWDLALQSIFRNKDITKNHTINRFTFSYFLPDLDLAIDTTPSDKKETVWKEYFCKQEKIKFISVFSQKDEGHRQLTRSLKRALAENAKYF